MLTIYMPVQRCVISILLALSLLLYGCSTSKNTVGIRVFNPSPRFHDDDVYIDVIELSDQSWVAASMQPGSHWSPLELYQLKKGVPLVVRLRYMGAAESDINLKLQQSEFVLDMQQNYDVHIRWEPVMDRPSIDDEENPDFDWVPHWARRPVIEVTPGHPDLF